MKIAPLTHTPLEEIVSCLVKAFEGYFVKMPSNLGYWHKRFEAAGVDYSLSTGLFDKDRLVGFIIHAIGHEGDEKIAFNTGTGIQEDYRGHKWVDQMYEFMLPDLLKQGITLCRLEVIDQNYRAIRVYERIGFEAKRRMRCFNGNLPTGDPSDYQLEPISLEDLENYGISHPYSWDHKIEVLQRLIEVSKFRLTKGKEDLGYVVINPQNGYILQIESKQKRWKEIFEALLHITPQVKINNVHAERTSLIHFLEHAGIAATVDQFEMDWYIDSGKIEP